MSRSPRRAGAEEQERRNDISEESPPRTGRVAGSGSGGGGPGGTGGGCLRGEGYTTGFEVDFSVDGKPVVTGGFVAFGQDAMGQYLYFAEPKGFVDNSYGANQVGWGSQDHTFDKLLGSDKAAFAFQTANGFGPFKGK